MCPTNSARLRGKMMANTTSAKKKVRRARRKMAMNASRRNRIRTFVKKVETAIDDGDKDTANIAFRAAQPELMRGVSRGVFKKNTATRKLARLSGRIKAI